MDGEPREAREATLGARYRTLFSLGRGGMGTVDVALERRDGGFERIVALKRLLPDAKRHHADMFLREARLAVLLEHPNVVHAFDTGELSGELFMAMEYVEGEPLSRVLAAARERSVPLTASVVARIVADVARGLHAAHELRGDGGAALGVVHRDVSPHNVMLSYDGAVKVVDFGVAKVDDQSGMTRTGEVKGKVAYMSPEQALGEKVDRRSDLYSLGAVLFECLAGRRMWEGTDMDVMRRHALGELPRLADARPDAPEELVQLHARLVAKAPTDRPASAAEVAEALSRVGEASSEELARLMRDLFAEEAATRRAALDRAIAGVGDIDGPALRKSLEPGYASRSGASRSGPPAMGVAAGNAPAPVRRSPWLPIAGAAAVVFAVAGTWRALRAAPATAPAPAPTAASPPPVPSLAPAAPLGAESASPTEGPTAPSSLPNPQKDAPRTGGSAAPPPSGPRAGLRPLAPRPTTAASAAPARSAPAAPPPPQTKKTLDVDPHAI